MENTRKISTALISVFDKEGLEPILFKLRDLGVDIISTGGTEQYIKDKGVHVTPVESYTEYPSILGGRVKTLHPKIFGGILARRHFKEDIAQLQEYNIPQIDLVIVDLYPFEDTVAATSDESQIVEKIDIGGISLIRACAKNFMDTVIVGSKDEYSGVLEILNKQDGITSIQQRKEFAAKAFRVSSHYDTKIFEYFNEEVNIPTLNISEMSATALRYGENPHQQASFHGNMSDVFTQLHGKALSFNNIVDIDASLRLISEFKEPACAIIKHTNACGLAQADTAIESWTKALSCDPISAFGGIIALNQVIDKELAEDISKIFFEVLIAPEFTPEAMEILTKKKNRILLQLHQLPNYSVEIKSVLNGYLIQDTDASIEKKADFNLVTETQATEQQLSDLEFAVICAKHLKSNTIALVKDKVLIGSGTGQTSRVDALRQAIHKAHAFKFDTNGAVMASDAFFPFPDCVEIAHEAGISAVVQPGGSIKDQDSIDYCNSVKMPMVTTGIRHFKH